MPASHLVASLADSPAVTADGIVVLGITAAVLLLLALGKASFAALGVGLVVVLPLTGILSPTAAASGFANKAVLTIAGLYVVGEGLTRTGAVDFVGRFLTWAGGGKETRTLAVLCATSAGLSAFVNDTAVVVVFIPLVLSLSARTGIPASRLLMPLAFASLLGGMCTLVGTSTNLIVSGVAESLGAEPLSLFSVTPVGVTMTVVGVAFMTAFTRLLLPVRQSLTVMMEQAPQRDFVTELSVGPDSALVGKTYGEALADAAATVLCFVRDESMRQKPFGDERIRAGDVILVSGSLEALARLTNRDGLDWLHGVKVDPKTVELFEVTLAPRSTLAGERLANLRLHEQFGATPVAVLRAGHHLHDRIGQLPIRAGDVMLVSGDDSARRRLHRSLDFSLLAGEPVPARPRAAARLALAIAGCVMVLLTLQAVAGWKGLPASSVALGGALAMVGTGVLDTRRAFAAIDWPILVFLAGTIALGEAMCTTGVAAWCANALLGVLAPCGVAAVASGFVLLGLGFNFLVAHSAVAVLFTPIALAAAQQMASTCGALPGTPEAASLTKAMLLAVCYGGSMCFGTPIAHQVNLMVWGPGGYRYRDYLRLGLPLALLVWAVATAGIPLLTRL